MFVFELWMGIVILVAFMLCAYFSFARGADDGMTKIMQYLLDKDIIEVDENGDVHPKKETKKPRVSRKNAT